MKCVFCENPDIKQRVALGRNELAWAFLTNIPVVPGHALVVPTRCVARFDELTPEEVAALFDLAMRVRKALVKTFDAEGFNYAWNENKVGGQSVPHFHLHVLPRKSGDTGITEYEPRKFLYRTGDREQSPEAELNAIARLIKQQM